MNLSYCADIVRRNDPDRFLLTLMCPARVRESLWALFALNYEIAKTREVVSETATGLIRLQWWRQAIEKIYEGEILQHEGIKPLSEAIFRHALPRKEFESLIYAREFDVEDRAPASIEGLHKYAEFTTVPLNLLALKILGQEEKPEAMRAVSVAYAITGLVRATPHLIRQRRYFLPEESMRRHQVTLSQLYDFGRYEAVRPVIRDVMESLAPLTVSPSAPLLRAQAAMAGMWSKKIKDADYNPYDLRLGALPNFYAVKTWLASKGW